MDAAPDKEVKGSEPNWPRAAAGGVGLLLSGIYLWEAFRLPMGTMVQPGAAFFPMVVGVFSLVVSGAVVTSAVARANHADASEEEPDEGGRKRLVLMMAIVLGYIVLIPHVGHFLSSLLFSVTLLKTLGTLSWGRAGIWGLILTAILHGVFVGLLGVRLPTGPLSL